MADNMMWCKNKHPDGVCKITGEYCVEGPCPHCKPVEYAPVRHGRWSCDDDDGFDNYDFHCTLCGGSIGYRCGNPVFSKHCLHCGAKMDLED